MLASRGDYVGFLDADDVWHATKLAVVARHLTIAQPAMLFHAYTEEAQFDEPGIAADDHQATCLSQTDFLWRNPAQTSCVVVRRDTQPHFDESMRYCEDHDLWLRLAEVEPPIFLAGAALTRLSRPQLSAGGASGNTIGMRLGEMTVYGHFWARRPLSRSLLLPLLIMFSALKHGRSALRRRRA